MVTTGSYRIPVDFAVKVNAGLGDLGVLLEPTTVVAKAWDHIVRIRRWATWQPATVLVTDAEPIGVPAALLGRQLDLEIHVLDQVTEGLKPQVADFDAPNRHGTIAELGIDADVVIECTGVAGSYSTPWNTRGPMASCA